MYTLKADPQYFELTEEQRGQLKCGPGEGTLEGLVPDKWRLGWPLYPVLIVTSACGPHDADYRWFAERNEIGRKKADERLRKNLCRLVFNAGGPRWLIKYRIWLAYKYYEYVRVGGMAAFYNF